MSGSIASIAWKESQEQRTMVPKEQAHPRGPWFPPAEDYIQVELSSMVTDGLGCVCACCVYVALGVTYSKRRAAVVDRGSCMYATSIYRYTCKKLQSIDVG